MISQKKFAAAALDLTKKVFIVYITYLDRMILIYLACKAKIALLIVNNIIILAKYLDIIDFFLKKLAIKLFNYLAINKHSINLMLDKQLSYSPNYSLRLVKLKIFKIYIKNNLAN